MKPSPLSFDSSFLSSLEENLFERKWSQVYQELSCLELSDDKLRRMMAVMKDEMNKGLSPNKKSCLKMLPSFVRSLPNGTEEGDYLALDLGGTNFRVLLIRLHGREAEMKHQTYRIPQSLMSGSGQKLFDHIADCLSKFVKENNLDGHLPLGFTFSFPCQQFSLTDAKLISWTKGFNCKDVVGANIVESLRDAVVRRNDVSVEVIALLNDTVGTQMALAHRDNDCHIGVIVGTGTNACYTEKLSRCPKLNDNLSEEMIINVEWGAFGDNGCIDFLFTPYDNDLDAETINPGKQRFEKMISGMYMGEIVRRVLEKLVRRGLLFSGQNLDNLFTFGKFSTKYVSEIESDLMASEKTFMNTFNILEDLGVDHVSACDCAIVAHVCAVVSTRAANLCGAAIAVLINRIKKSKVTVGVDGSVYRFHPTFAQNLERAVSRLIEPGLSFSMKLSEDGSGRGAALVAAVAHRLRKEAEAQKDSKGQRKQNS